MTANASGNHRLPSRGAQSVSNPTSLQRQQQQQLKLLELGFVHLTGGADSAGRAVICFPPRQIIRMHLNSVAAPELASMIDFLVSIAPAEAYPPSAAAAAATAHNRHQNARGLAFLADFRACSQSIFRIVIDALESVQSHAPGSVAVFYALMPRSKELAKSLQKALGLYQKKSFLPSRKSAPDPNAKSFQSVLLPTSQELFQFVSKTNLMLDFGGTLNYDHAAWMRLRSSFDNLLFEVANIADKAPAALERLSNLQNNSAMPGDSAADDDAAFQESAHGMQDQFQRVTAELGLEATSERVAQLLSACKEPANHPETRPLTGNILLLPYVERLQKLQKRLEDLKSLLQDRWKQSEAGLLVDGRMTSHKRAATDLCDWFDRWGKEAVKRSDTRPIANHQMAEDALEKLRLQVLEPSAAKVSECRALIGKLRQLASAAPPSSRAEPVNEANQLADELEAKLRTFNEKVKLAREKLTRLCAFYAGCTKTLKWYRHCMKKLPLDLLHPDRHRPHHRLQSNDNLPIDAKWADVAASYLRQHPEPGAAQLDELKEAMTLIENSDIRKEAQLLLYRISLLKKLLNSTPTTKLSEGVITVGQFLELIDCRDRQAEPDGDSGFAALEFSQSLASTSEEDELRALEASPIVAAKPVAPTFQFPPMEREEVEQQSGARFRRRTERSVASSSRSGTEVVEVIPQPIVINHRLMARPPARGYDAFEKKERFETRKEEDAISCEVVTSLESLPKEETVRRYLENMITPPPPLTATTDESVRSGSRMGRSLSNLVGELKDLKEALFYGSASRAHQAPVARRGRRFQQPHLQQQYRPNLAPAVTGQLLRSRSEQNLISQPATDDPIGNRQRKLLLLQLDEPPSTRGVAYPVEVIDIQNIIGDIREIAADRYKLQHQRQAPHTASRNRLTSGEAVATGYSMSRMSDIDPVGGNYSFDDLAGDEDIGRDIRPSRHSDNFLLLASPDNRPTAVGGRSHSPRSMLVMPPPQPPSIPEEADVAEAVAAAERHRWRRRDNRVWLHNTYNSNFH